MINRLVNVGIATGVAFYETHLMGVSSLCHYFNNRDLHGDDYLAPGGSMLVAVSLVSAVLTCPIACCRAAREGINTYNNQHAADENEVELFIAP